MTIRDNILRILKSEWVIALFLLLGFLLTNGYTYAWDDQHLEIPLLKSLIDADLYVGDYYVDSLKQNFTSFLYPILARLITIDQIQPTYLVLYLATHYIFFLFTYKLWLLISRKKLTAVLCVAAFFLVGRVEEFLYRTFSHQELALCIIIAGIYFFYRERFVLAAAIFGIAANFHALYSLFPFFYMTVYLFWYRRTPSNRTLWQSWLAFSLCTLPFLIWTAVKYSRLFTTADPGLYDNWLALYRIACPQNFLFHEHLLKNMLSSLPLFLEATKEFWTLLFFYLLNFFHNPVFRRDTKVQAIMASGFGLLLFSFIFSYIIPLRFVLDLNLIRNAQFMLFLLMGYTVVLLMDLSGRKAWLTVLVAALLFPFIRYTRFVTPLVGCTMLFWLSFQAWWGRDKGTRRNAFLIVFGLGFLLSLAGMLTEFFRYDYSQAAKITLWGILAAVVVVYLLHFWLKGERAASILTSLFVIIPVVLFAANYVYYHKLRLKVEKTAGGFWQMQRNWIDMQTYVREHTPKNALILVPHDMEMGGFRIFSERKIVMSYRDCGVIGFDYQAAVEWQNRLNDIEAFKVFINASISEALMKAVVKYKVNYIVFMGYMDPGKNDLLKPVYANGVFALYKVLPNPVL